MKSLANVVGIMQLCLFRDNRDNILISYYMSEANSLGDMSCTCPPNQCILEMISQCAMDLVTNLFNGGIVPNNEGITKLWVDTFSTTSQNHNLPNSILGVELTVCMIDDQIGTYLFV